MKLNGYADPVAQFLHNIKLYCKDGSCQELRGRFAMEFGYDPFEIQDVDKILEYLNSKFLVLILERLSESLIVMKRKLCWKTKDILFSHFKLRSYPNKDSVNDSLISLHQAFNPLDYVFYSYFSKVMAHNIANQGQNFQEEVAFFEDCSEKTRAFCDVICQDMVHLTKSKSPRAVLRQVLDRQHMFEESMWEDAFTISGLDCLMMKFRPKDYEDAQKVLLYPEYCQKSAKHMREKYKINDHYCHDHFNYTFPWYLLEHLKFQ